MVGRPVGRLVSTPRSPGLSSAPGSGWRFPGLACPGVRDELAKEFRRDDRQAHQDRWETVVVRLREEDVGVAGDQDRLLRLVTNPDRQHVGAGNPGFPGLGPLQPNPNEALEFALGFDTEGEVRRVLPGAGKRERDLSDVRLARQTNPKGRAGVA